MSTWYNIVRTPDKGDFIFYKKHKLKIYAIFYHGSTASGLCVEYDSETDRDYAFDNLDDNYCYSILNQYITTLN